MRRTVSAVAAAILLSMMALIFLGDLLKKAAVLLMVLRMEALKHLYEVRRRTDRRGFDLISDVLALRTAMVPRGEAVSNAVA
jgi:hypothetical protein